MRRDSVVPAWVGAVSGVLAGAAALAAGQLAAALTVDQPGPVTSVANTVRDASPAWFTRWAIDAFGTADKPLLLSGVVVVSLLIAAGLGSAARRRRLLGVAGLAAFGLVGIWSMATEPTGSDQAAVAVGVVAVAVGVAVLLGLLAVAGADPVRPARPRAPAVVPSADGGFAADPRARLADRRRFLVASGLVGAGVTVTALAGRPGRDPAAAELARRSITLPPAAGAAALQAEVATVQAHPVAATPGISTLLTPNDDFYRIDTALFVPQVDVDRWRLRVTGMVRRELEFSYEQLVQRATTVVPLTLACVSNPVGGPLVGTALWQGVPLQDLLDEAGVDPAADQLVGRSVDGWTAGFPTGMAGDGRTALVAVAMNGQPLPVRHGFPARLVVAGLYGYVSATKWLQQIELTTWDGFDAYWVPRGWSKEGPMKTQSRIDTPRSDGSVRAGPVPVAGVAWAPNLGIERVEVQIDDGPWAAAELGPRLDDDTWVQWRLAWAAEAGRHRLRVRATDRSGTTQTDERRPVAPDGATGWHTVEVDVD